MKKIYHLGSCNTCQRIIKELDAPADMGFQEIKTEPLNTSELDKLRGLAGSYEALFSRRARIYKERNLRGQPLGEADLRELLLEHYTFLKRPVIVVDDKIFIGNAAKTVAAAKESLHS